MAPKTRNSIANRVPPRVRWQSSRPTLLFLKIKRASHQSHQKPMKMLMLATIATKSPKIALRARTIRRLIASHVHRKMICQSSLPTLLKSTNQTKIIQNLILTQTIQTIQLNQTTRTHSHRTTLCLRSKSTSQERVWAMQATEGHTANIKTFPLT